MGSRVWTGDDDLDRVLSSLERKTGNRVARSALGRALSELVKMIKAEIPHRTIKRAIGKRNKKGRGGRHGAKAGFNVGSAKEKGAPHAHLLAMGTADRYTGARQYRGKVEPHEWIRRAMAQAPARMRARLVEGFNKALERELKKVNPYRAKRMGSSKNVSTADVKAAMRGA